VSELTLFDAEPEPREPEPRESEGRRRTKRQLAILKAGRHPLSLLSWAPALRLHPDAPPADDRKADGPRCGTCRFLEPWGAHGFLKCLRGENEGFATHSAATDIRRWWPACSFWEAAS
jgi:hypothetical protein